MQLSDFTESRLTWMQHALIKFPYGWGKKMTIDVKGGGKDFFFLVRVCDVCDRQEKKRGASPIETTVAVIGLQAWMT